MSKSCCCDKDEQSFLDKTMPLETLLLILVYAVLIAGLIGVLIWSVLR